MKPVVVINWALDVLGRPWSVYGMGAVQAPSVTLTLLENDYDSFHPWIALGDVCNRQRVDPLGERTARVYRFDHRRIRRDGDA